MYPLIFTFLPRLWSVSHKHGYVTTSDFVRGRFGSKGLSLAVAVTGILATMPYIALQLVGIQAVLDVMGVGGGENTSWFVKDLPLLIAFAVLAAYVLLGLRAPALIAFVKDGLIYLVIAVAIIYIPIKLGGFDDIFAKAGDAFSQTNPATGKPRGASRRPIPANGVTRPWPWGRRSPSSCTRTRSRRRSPAAAVR